MRYRSLSPLVFLLVRVTTYHFCQNLSEGSLPPLPSVIPPRYPYLLPVRIIAEPDIYHRFPAPFWSVQIAELNLLLQTLPESLETVIRITRVEIANITSVTNGIFHTKTISINPFEHDSNGIAILVTGETSIDTDQIWSKLCKEGISGTRENVLNFPLAAFLSTHNKWRMAVRLLDRIYDGVGDGTYCDMCDYHAHAHLAVTTSDPFMINHCKYSGELAPEQSCFIRHQISSISEYVTPSFLTGNESCRWIHNNSLAWTNKVDCKLTQCYGNDGRSVGFVVPPYNTPCDTGQVCKRGQCLHVEFQVVNVQTKLCLHVTDLDSVYLTRCREATYLKQRFIFGKDAGLGRHYIMHTSFQNSVYTNSCLTVHGLPQKLTPYGHIERGSVKLDSCAWGNESFLWTLIKTPINGLSQFRIFNEKHHQYLLGSFSGIIQLSDTDDPFDKFYLWTILGSELDGIIYDKDNEIDAPKVKTNATLETHDKTGTTSALIWTTEDNIVVYSTASSVDYDFDDLEYHPVLVNSLGILIPFIILFCVCIGCCLACRGLYCVNESQNAVDVEMLPVTFYNGAAERLNPELEPLQQLELLPFDTAWEFPERNLRIGVKLGEGAFGTVFMGTAKNILKDGKTRDVAIKMLKPGEDREKYEALTAEMKILGNINFHCNIVNLLGVCTRRNEIKVILELCALGDIKSYLVRNRASFQNELLYAGVPPWNQLDALAPCRENHSNNPLTTSNLTCWGFQVADGMNYLSAKRIIHGDLAARNVLLTTEKIVKICDFGLSRQLYQNYAYNYKKDIQGALLPFKWMAIESIKYGLFSIESDGWSFGVLLWELYSLGQNPYPGIDANQSLIDKIESGYRMEKPEYAPSHIYDMMLQCWSSHPEKRPTFSMLTENLKARLDNGRMSSYNAVIDDYKRMNKLRHKPTVEYLVDTFQSK